MQIQCPQCGRAFSEYLVKFPVAMETKDGRLEYFVCPLCARQNSRYKHSVNSEPSFTEEYAEELYQRALLESKISKKKQVKQDPDPQTRQPVKPVRLYDDREETVEQIEVKEAVKRDIDHINTLLCEWDFLELPKIVRESEYLDLLFPIYKLLMNKATRKEMAKNISMQISGDYGIAMKADDVDVLKFCDELLTWWKSK